jgi:hypothetical protein
MLEKILKERTLFETIEKNGLKSRCSTTELPPTDRTFHCGIGSLAANRNKPLATNMISSGNRRGAARSG